ncbi:MAG: hypothetical protein HFH49_17195 [Lachnospiraceae bacterium]|nr:hypothetical protein [Lachnospiraceae bacterium]
MSENKNLRMGISLLLSFFLAAAVFLAVLAVVIKTGYLPGNSWRNYLAGSSYGNEISGEAEEKFAELLEYYGLPAEVAGELIRQEELQAVYSRWQEECWTKGEETKGQREKSEGQIKEQREKFEGQLKEQVTSYLTGYQTPMTEQIETDILALTEEAGRIYENYLSSAWLIQMQKLKEKYQGMLIAAMLAGSLAAILCGLALWRIHRYKHRAIRFVCIAMGTVCLWSGLLLVLLKQNRWIDQAGIASFAYREMVGGLMKIGMQNGLFALGAEIWLFAVLAVWSRHLKHHAA